MWTDLKKQQREARAMRLLSHRNIDENHLFGWFRSLVQRGEDDFANLEQFRVLREHNAVDTDEEDEFELASDAGSDDEDDEPVDYDQEYRDLSRQRQAEQATQGKQSPNLASHCPR